jgi:hypothetical protein
MILLLNFCYCYLLKTYIFHESLNKTSDLPNESPLATSANLLADKLCPFCQPIQQGGSSFC